MGLGKTLQSVALTWTLLKQGPYGGKPVAKLVLVVAPGSLVQNWGAEFKKWLGRERINVYTVNQVGVCLISVYTVNQVGVCLVSVYTVNQVGVCLISVYTVNQVGVCLVSVYTVNQVGVVWRRRKRGSVFPCSAVSDLYGDVCVCSVLCWSLGPQGGAVCSVSSPQCISDQL
jgi:hypothetical protein